MAEQAKAARREVSPIAIVEQTRNQQAKVVTHASPQLSHREVSATQLAREEEAHHAYVARQAQPFQQESATQLAREESARRRAEKEREERARLAAEKMRRYKAQVCVCMYVCVCVWRVWLLRI